jgi:hypothetical protein
MNDSMPDFDYEIVVNYFPFVDIEELYDFVNSLKTKVANRELKVFDSILYFQDFYFSFMENELKRLEMLLEIDIVRDMSDFMNFLEDCIKI